MAGNHSLGLAKRKRFRIRGIVQGVGFRPFIFNQARRLGLGGFILNCSSGVVIEIEGTDQALDRFLVNLAREAPPLARVETIEVSDIEACGERCFEIRESVSERNEFNLVSPDVATCDECWSDSLHPGNRRYGYPFTNCTNCGLIRTRRCRAKRRTNSKQRLKPSTISRGT